MTLAHLLPADRVRHSRTRKHPFATERPEKMSASANGESHSSQLSKANRISISVRGNGSQIRVPAGFAVVADGRSNVWVNSSGRSAIRVGTPSDRRAGGSGFRSRPLRWVTTDSAATQVVELMGNGTP